MRRSLFPVALGVTLTLAVTAGRTHAQDPEIPAGFTHVETTDVTATLRDDTYTTIAVDPEDANTAYLGTIEGRIYRTSNGGRTWTEATVLDDPGNAWQLPGTPLFAGSFHAQGAPPMPIDLSDHDLDPVAFSAHLPGSLASTRTLTSVSDPFATVGGGDDAGGFFGVGLSTRSPRISQFPFWRNVTLNRVRWLVTAPQRRSAITRIAIAPDDTTHLWAATDRGLYESRDAGATWTSSFAGIGPGGERLAQAVAARDGVVVVGTSRGAFRSDDGGTSWRPRAVVEAAAVHDIAFDPKDASTIYVAVAGALLRSTNGGDSFVAARTAETPDAGDVLAVAIDPIDPATAYVGTRRGAYVSHDVTQATPSWTALDGLGGTRVVRLRTCSKHKGHVYAVTRVDLPSLGYGAEAPDSAVWESWNGGRTWRAIFTGTTAGQAQDVELDPDDPDRLWIVWSTAVHRLAHAVSEPAAVVAPVDEPAGPRIEELVVAALRHHGLELTDYAAKLDKARSSQWLPHTLFLTARIDNWTTGGRQDDNQFAQERYLQGFGAHEWSITAWASWDLPSLVYRSAAVPMIRQRTNMMNDQARQRLIETIRRDYGEVQRLRGTLAATKLDLEARVAYRLRIDQLEAVVDLTSGGYLTGWTTTHRRHSK
ncbi:MAG TPA: hypothetical protein VGO00_16120 [Kofleriaceae bacterium]|nr:hypothetical protein [Kofleriaceae bacterium]